MNKFKSSWVDISIFLLTLAVIWIAYKLCLRDYINFCNAYLSNLLSDLAVALVFGFFFIRFYESRNRPNPIFVVNDEENLTISKESAKTGGFVLSFGVLNKNRKALKQNDGFYHILINKELSPELRSGTTGREKFIKNPDDLDNFVEITDANPGPCLHNSILTTLEIACKLHTEVDESIIYYYINTESGIYPNKIQFKNKKRENIKTWGKIKIKFT